MKSSRLGSVTECSLALVAGFIGAAVGSVLDNRHDRRQSDRNLRRVNDGVDDKSSLAVRCTQSFIAMTARARIFSSVADRSRLSLSVSESRGQESGEIRGGENTRLVLGTKIVAVFTLAIFGSASLVSQSGDPVRRACFGVTVLMLLAATLVAISRSGQHPLRWTGFAVFGWTYLFGEFEIIPSPYRARPQLATEDMLQYIWLLSNGPFHADVLSIDTFHYLGHLVLTIVVGLIGALIGDLLLREKHNCSDPRQR